MNLYAQVYGPDAPIASQLDPPWWEEYDWATTVAGRIILPIAPDHDCAPGEINWQWYCDNLTEHDIVWIPLYRGNQMQETPQEHPFPLDAYNENLEALRALAPKVKGIMLGNNGAELMYQRLMTLPEARGKDMYYTQQMVNVKLLCQFVENTAPLVLKAGGRPVYGLVDWGIIADRYSGRSTLQRLLTIVGGAALCFCGFTLVPEAIFPRDNALYAQQQQTMEQLDRAPHIRMQEYLRAGEFWSECNGPEGIEAGNPQALLDFGFKQIFVGK